jgi:Uma2 family endonuclease
VIKSGATEFTLFTFGGGRHYPGEFDDMATEVLEQPTEERLVRRRATAEEFWSLPESVLPVEYVNGEIVMAPTPTVPHQRATFWMASVLQQFVIQNRLGEIFISPLDVVLPTGAVVQPDIFFLDPRQAARARTARRVTDTPPFLIEILSPSSIAHDTITKRALYEKNGVREYWIVDVEKRSVAQLVLRKKHYALTELGEADVIKGVVLAGFETAVGGLLGA